MHITLIRPSFGTGPAGRYDSPARLEPLALAVLAALTPRGITLTAYDERFEAIPLDRPTDLVALSVCTFSARRAYQLADEYRRRGVRVVLGGFHPTLLPEEAAVHADAVALGDAEHCWPAIVADAAAGRLAARYGTPGPAPAVRPDRSVLARGRYLPVRLIQFGRGCPHTCEFCAVRAFYQGDHCTRPVAEVVEEIRQTRARRLFFVDDNLLADRAAARALLEALIPLRVRWSAQLDLGLAADPGLLELARRSGCQSVTIGFESLQPENLVQMGKRWSRAEEYAARLARLRDAGIMVYGTFLFGYDQDDAATIARTVRFAQEQHLFLANFNPLQPLPGTPLYARLEQEGRLVAPRWWLQEEYRWHQALVRPARMTPAELTAGCRQARAAFHSTGSMVRRFLGGSAHWRNLDNLGVYWGTNLVSRLDIRAKVGLRLGE